MNNLMVLVIEAILVLIVTTLTFLFWHRRPWVLLLFPLLGATGLALAHGLIFFSSTTDAGMLAGFGMVVALFFGLPAGFLAGGVGLLWWLGTRK
jgi:hypothetical protein